MTFALGFLTVLFFLTSLNLLMKLRRANDLHRVNMDYIGILENRLRAAGLFGEPTGLRKFQRSMERKK